MVPFRDAGEVWLTAKTIKDKSGKETVKYRRVFLTAFEDINTVAVAEEMALDDKSAWLLWTFYPRENVNSLREGDLIYRRRWKKDNGSE